MNAAQIDIDGFVLREKSASVPTQTFFLATILGMF